MSAVPLFVSNAVPLWGSLTAANTALDGTGTTLVLAPAVKCRVRSVICRHLGTNVVTVARVFVNNGSSAATPANNSLIEEATIAANTLSQIAASPKTVIPLGSDGGIILPSTHKILITIGTAVAAGIQFYLEIDDLT